MMSRPSERRSMLDSCLASVTGLRRGKTRMPVPIFNRFVRAAIPVRAVSESIIGKLGSTPSSMWSHTHTES
jgi:hypothetical protein